MSDALIVDRYETKHQVYNVKRDSQGREYVHHEGEGIVGYLSGKGGVKDGRGDKIIQGVRSNSLQAQAERGDISLNEFIERSSVISEDTFSRGVDLYDRGTVERFRATEQNRFLGFALEKGYDINNEADFKAALQRYIEFRSELVRADTYEEEQEIKEQFGLGGS